VDLDVQLAADPAHLALGNALLARVHRAGADAVPGDLLDHRVQCPLVPTPGLQPAREGATRSLGRSTGSPSARGMRRSPAEFSRLHQLLGRQPKAAQELGSAPGSGFRSRSYTTTRDSTATSLPAILRSISRQQLALAHEHDIHLTVGKSGHNERAGLMTPHCPFEDLEWYRTGALGHHP
jgi:hypothetical protein